MNRLTFLFIFFLFIFYGCNKIDVNNGNSNLAKTIQVNVAQSKINTNIILQKALEFQLSQTNSKDSNAFYLLTGSLISGDLFGDNTSHAFTVINNYKMAAFKYQAGKWEKYIEIPFNSEYQGFKLQDLNGDNCMDLLLKEYYLYSNKSYKVFLYNCNNATLTYDPEFDGIMNPFYDTKTGLINSFLFTNHGEESKETYKRVGESLILNERVTIDGLGVEDIDNHKYVIKHYRMLNKKETLIQTFKLTNANEASSKFDNLLFDYFIYNDTIKPLRVEDGWIQME